MRLFLMLIASAMLLGCSTTSKKSNKPDPNWEWLFSSTCPGLRPEDPQLCRGETWTQLPNQPFEAQIRRARGEQW